MSLDVYLYRNETIYKRSSGIFIRKDDVLEEISIEEWGYMCSGHTPTFSESAISRRLIYADNITHNLREMARVAGIYTQLWEPEKLGITKAKDLIEPLSIGLEKLRKSPAEFCKYAPSNGYGTYNDLVKFVSLYLEACKENPDTAIQISR